MFDTSAIPYLAGEWLAATIALTASISVWRRRATPGACGLAITLWLCAWWSFWHGISLAAATLPGKIGAAGLWEIGAISVNASYLLFAIEYERQRKWPARRAALLFVPALFFLALFWTNPWHYLFWSRTVLVTGAPFTRIGVAFGAAGWLFAGWSNVYLISVTVLLLRVAMQHHGLYRRQVALILVGLSVPWATYLLFFTGHYLVPNYDVTTLSLTLNTSLIAWAIYGQKLLDIIPVAHSLVIEGMSDAVVVLDDRDRVVYSNAAAAMFAGSSERDLVGRPLAAGLPELARMLDQGRTEFARGIGGEQRLFELRVSPLRNGPDGDRGRVLVLRDETDRRRVTELQRSRQQVLAAEESLRRRIAEMLHGPIQSKLLSAWIRLGQVHERWGDALTPEARGLVTSVRDDIDRVREEDIRHASHLLHPAGLRVGLLPALDYLAGGYEDFFEVDLSAGDDVRELDAAMCEDLRLVAYRVVEEALNNTAKHARAEHVKVLLSAVEGSLHVEIRDDGAGFDPARVLPGFGFHGISGRVDQCAGAWSIDSTPGRGASLRLSLPVPPPAEPAHAILSPFRRAVSSVG